MKRYDVYCECETATDVELSPDGEWVRAEDALALKQVLEQLIEEHGLAHNKLMGLLRTLENDE